jgi:uncharacterized FAD-dependent dehydrogenase
MIKNIEISIRPSELNNETDFIKIASRKLNLRAFRIKHVRILKKSLDARSKFPIYRLKLEVFIDELPAKEATYLEGFINVKKKKEVLIIGAGPAGYFAALELIESGYKPVILERGKDVRNRRKDLKAIQQDHIVNPNSNYCYGEGGAGTYSDGKLYTRSHKRGKIEKVLKLLVEHGASTDILIEAHPHIGSNKLPEIVSEIRNTITSFGGEVHFESQVTDISIKGGKITGVTCHNDKHFDCDQVILATGHSARDIFYMLHKKKIKIENKPFALGVRIEHPQALIDEMQYNQSNREQNLPASSYSLACQVDGHGVFSFCMCPGGLIVPAATSPGEIVLNGMSLSRRDSKYANAGTVVAIDSRDLDAPDDVWSSLNFQKHVEQTMFNAGDGSQKAPTQRLTDFVNGRLSADLNDCSYIPGIYRAPLHELLPGFIYDKLRLGIIQFDKKKKGYFTEEANVLATESRTSSPIRIPRDKETFMHPDCIGLYPCGEGAGYAGGILSAAMDGQNVAKAIKANLS